MKKFIPITIIAFLLSGCYTSQPPGADLSTGLRHIEQQQRQQQK